MIRLMAIVLSINLLVACGNGGDSSGAEANPLTVFMPTAGSSSHQAIQEITNIDGAALLFGDIYEAGNLNSTHMSCRIASCAVNFSPVADPVTFDLANNFPNLSFLSTPLVNANSRITNSVNVDGATFARGILTGTIEDTPLEFQTFTGWLDGNIFGAVQISIGEADNQRYRFTSYTVGVPAGSDPGGTGSATWEGIAVASIKANRNFIRGDATITVGNLADGDADVDLLFDNWRTINNQTISDVAAVSYDARLDGKFGYFESSIRDEQVEGWFYGANHEGVGGFFNTVDITGAFGGIRR